jgi:YggT family protein
MVFLQFVRFAAFGICVFFALVAVGSWAIRTRRINPFSAPGQRIRRVTDAVLAPIEQRTLRHGGNPQHAGWWLVGIGLVGGIVGVSLTEWLVVQAAQLSSLRTPAGAFRAAVYYAGNLILLALVVRVIGSWFGVGRYTRWMRPVYVLTDWAVEPLRKIVPPFGSLDITPIIAWILIRILVSWLMTVL